MITELRIACTAGAMATAEENEERASGARGWGWLKQVMHVFRVSA